jgi:hypothetical protein
MDKNSDLILTNAAKSENWEDQQKPTDDVQALQREFNERLYSRKAQQAAAKKNGKRDDK